MDLDQIEITPEMIEAGVAELYENFRLRGDYGEIVPAIYQAMYLTSPQQLRQAN